MSDFGLDYIELLQQEVDRTSAVSLSPETGGGGGGPQVCRAGVSVCFPDISSPLTADYLDQLVSGDQGYVGKQAGPTPAAQLGLESSFL